MKGEPWLKGLLVYKLILMSLLLFSSFSFYGCKGEGGGSSDSSVKKVKPNSTSQSSSQNKIEDSRDKKDEEELTIKSHPLLKMQAVSFNGLESDSSDNQGTISESQKKALLNLSQDIRLKIDPNAVTNKITHDQKNMLIKLQTIRL